MSIGTGGIVAAVVLAVVILALIWALASAMRSTPKDISRGAGPVGPAPDQIRPVLVGFHVHGDMAEVSYGVPLPDGDVDGHLRDILRHDASLVLHEKRSHGLPMDQVVRIKVLGQRDGQAAEVDVIELEEPGVIPEIAAPELVPHASFGGYDPIAHFGEQEFDVEAGVVDRRPDEALSPFLDEITLTGALDAHLRAQGIDPSHASINDLTLSLLRLGGYEVAETPTSVSMLQAAGASTYVASKDDSKTLVVVVEHHAGEHPELSESTVNGFAFAVAEQSPDRALLITDQFGPYIVYEKERSDPRCRFITRERLQAFVDSFAVR